MKRPFEVKLKTSFPSLKNALSCRLEHKIAKINLPPDYGKWHF